jgi:hypothetical protein
LSWDGSALAACEIVRPPVRPVANSARELYHFNVRTVDDCGILVCEKTGRWAIALRRALAMPSRLCETRSWAACWREVSARSDAIVAVEVLPGNVEAACQRLVDLTQRFPQVRVIVMADRSLRSAEWLFREAGAVHVLFAPDQWHRLRPMFRRFIDHLPPSPTPFREQVWASLPWARYATEAFQTNVLTKGSENGQRPA